MKQLSRGCRDRCLSGALGEYELLERISNGGMAEVFRARLHGAAGLERICAIKRILPEVAGDSRFVAMFVDEAKIAAQLHHPNIAQTFDLGISNGEYFIAMEYIDGVDVRTLVKRCREIGAPIPRRHACRIVAEVCAALSYAHSKRDDAERSMNVVHRDVSPPNVLLSRCGEVKLIDFGVAKATKRRARTATGYLKGKTAYLAPEQVLGLAADHRADIFAAGVLLWELLANDRLFQGATDLAVLEQIRRCDHALPSKRNPSVPAELDQIVAKALARDPDDRYQDAGELQDRLREYVRCSGEYSTARHLATWTARVMSAGPADDFAPPTIQRHSKMLEPGGRSSVVGRIGRGTPRPTLRANSSARLSTVHVQFNDEPTGAKMVVDMGEALTSIGPMPTETPLDRAIVRMAPPPNRKPTKQREPGINSNVVRRIGRGTPRPFLHTRTDARALPATIDVRFESDPPGANVVVVSGEGLKTIGTTPVETTLKRGTLRVGIRKAGYVTCDDSLVLGSQEAVTVTATLHPKDVAGLSETRRRSLERSMDYDSYFLIC